MRTPCNISIQLVLAAVCCVPQAALPQAILAQVSQDYYWSPGALGGGAPEWFADENVEQATMLLQQPAPRPTAPSVAIAPRGTATGPRQSGLASVPNMFGDCGPTTANITIRNANGAILDAGFDLPVIGGARTGKMAENGNALPVDRVYFLYNHFHNAFEMESQFVAPPGPAFNRQDPIDRYTLGLEKTFFDQMTSVEIRMPFNGQLDADLPGLTVSNGSVGNLAVILKALLYQDDYLGVGVGLAIDTPTGSDTIARTSDQNLQFFNEAVHFLPYIGFLYSPGDAQFGWGDSWFMSGFFQFDAAASGNPVALIDPVSQLRTDLGTFTEQNAIFLDFSLGYWLYRDPDAYRCTGLAVIGEAHYTTSVQDADLVAATAGGTGAVVSCPLNRFDVVNLVAAVQALFFDASALRVGAVLPAGMAEDKRFFDAAVQVQFNRRF